MGKFVAMFVVAVLLMSPGVLAESGKKTPSCSAAYSANWKEIQRVSGIVTSGLEKHRQDGTSPDAFFAPATTALCYRLIALAAYYRPKTVEEAGALLVSAPTEIGVLAKQLREYNLRQGSEDPESCLNIVCKKRRVAIALTQQGLGIGDEPFRAAPGKGKIIYEGDASVYRR